MSKSCKYPKVYKFVGLKVLMKHIVISGTSD